MFFGLTSPCTRATRWRGVALREPPRALPRRSGCRAAVQCQVGLEPERQEDRVGVEVSGIDPDGGGVKLRQSPADRAGKCRIGISPAQPGLPDRVGVRRQIGHREQPRLAVLGQDRRRRGGNRAPGLAQPGRLGGVALDSGARQSAATLSLASARLTTNTRCLASTSQISDATPPVSGRNCAGSSGLSRPSLASGAESSSAAAELDLVSIAENLAALGRPRKRGGRFRPPSQSGQSMAAMWQICHSSERSVK